MPLQAGDIRFALPSVTNDTDNGGGPPSSRLLPDGASNALFPDISEDARTGGLVEIRHLHGVLRNTDTDPLLGANIIVAEPPDDPNVSLTLIKSPSTFARRPDLVKLIEATTTPGPEFTGFILENHVQGQRSLQVAQRPGVEPPSVNTTLVMIYDEGLPTERAQYVRVRRATVTQQVFTESGGVGGYTDYPVQVASCELFSPLEYDFPGSPFNRFYARTGTNSRLRKANVTDAGTFYSASRLREPVLADSKDVLLDTVYTQLVPNTKTETPLLNQFPGGLRTFTLTDSQGSFQVTSAAHSQSILVQEANRGFSYVAKLTPPPAPNSVSVSYQALGQWQTIVDNGEGVLGGGSGSGNVLYTTGDLDASFDAQPDINTPIIITHGDTAAFVNRVVSPTPRAILPEFAIGFTAGANVDGATISWESGGTTYTATSNAAGTLSGDATGTMVGTEGVAYLQTTHMPEPGSNFLVSFASRPVVVESFSGVTVDAAGIASLTTAQEAIPGTLSVKWLTARKVSASSGSDLTGTSTKRASDIVGSLGFAVASPSLITPGNAIWRTTVSNTRYSESTQSTTTDTQVIAHSITDDGAGGFGEPTAGSVNYAGKSFTLRLVSLGGTVESYKSDYTKAAYFYEGAASMSVSHS